MAYIREPDKIPMVIKLALRFAEKKTGRRMLPGRLLAWQPRAAIGAGVLESLVTHDDVEVPARLLKLIRIQVSFLCSCGFCIDMNSADFEAEGISEEEIRCLQQPGKPVFCPTFSEREKAALAWVRGITATPIRLTAEELSRVKHHFSERGMVIIVTTAAQVNFWTRTVQGLGIPPAGFSESCSVLNLEKYTTLNSPE